MSHVARRPGLTREIEVAGARIRWGVRGNAAGPDLLLVHGNGANHSWWNSVARNLEDRWRLILLDLSGHGDSDHRVEYRPDLWVEEVMAVAQVAGSVRPVLVGHSMGGRVCLAAAAAHPDAIAGLVVLDASVRPPHLHRDHPTVSRRENRFYASHDEIVSRFRLLPAQPPAAPEIMADLAEHVVVETPLGWTWKYDPQSLMRFKDSEVDAATRVLRSPLGYVYGSESVVVDEVLADHVRQIVPSARVVRVDDAHHHLILDQPQVCSALIDEMASAFQLTSELS